MDSSENTQQQQPNINNNIWNEIDAAKRNSSKYKKFQENEKAVLQFNLNKIRVVDSTFKGKPTGGYSIEYTILEPRVNPERERVLSITLSKTDNINALLKKGITLLEVEMQGSGQKAEYIATPV
jgi:hypothetical protein